MKQGFDIREPQAQTKLNDGSFIPPMVPFWFNKNKDFDTLCQSFIPVLRDAGKNQLKAIYSDDDNNGGINYWETVDGHMARILLCDQLTQLFSWYK